MATIGYKGALGGMAKDAIKVAGNALVGGLKGAVLREMPAVTAGMAFGKELSKRANAPKMQPGGIPPPTASTSSAMGGFGASVSLVAGQNKSNVINIEQVRQLKQLNDAVASQSKLIAFQIADQKRKDQFAEEAANEQAFRDDELLKAIKNLGAGFGGGTKNKNAGGGEGGGLGGGGEGGGDGGGGEGGGGEGGGGDGEGGGGDGGGGDGGGGEGGGGDGGGGEGGGGAGGGEGGGYGGGGNGGGGDGDGGGGEGGGGDGSGGFG
jgi:hypothetical protein